LAAKIRGAIALPNPQDETMQISDVLQRKTVKNGFRTAFFSFSKGMFSKFTRNLNFNFLTGFRLQLEKAEIDLSAADYLSAVIFAIMLAGILSALLATALYLIQFRSGFIFLLIPLSILVVLFVGLYGPTARSSSRGKRIDENLGSAFAFISAMSNADVPINIIFLKMAGMKEYGEVAKEASKIARRTELLGIDIFTAMKEVARTSPSSEWQKFLQGAVATSTAGARLKPYFVNKASEYQNVLRVSLKKNAESVTVFAETYVTVGVAFPLFLIVILAVMAVIARNAAGTTISFLIFFSLLVLPVITAAFVILISSVNKEVQIS
jgi:flagellar protein FlaJ